jgi:hypothetical protein
VPFYRYNGLVYGCIYTISTNKASPIRLTNSLHWEAHMFIGARRCACSAMATMWLNGDGAMRISICALMRVIEPDPEVGDCPGNGIYLYCLTGVHVTNRIIPCSFIHNKNLACNEGTRLDYSDVISATGEPGMAIITLSRLYFVLSCRLSPTDDVPM